MNSKNRTDNRNFYSKLLISLIESEGRQKMSMLDVMENLHLLGNFSFFGGGGAGLKIFLEKDSCLVNSS